MTAKGTILPTQNEAWGFYGTIAQAVCGTEAQVDAWNNTSEQIRRATGCSAAATRAFLDSRYGRHFADDVSNGITAGQTYDRAIEATIAKWMRWRITPRITADTGIPTGLPYLTGFTEYCGIVMEVDR